MNKALLLLAILPLSLGLYAQSVPVPAPAQSKPMLLRGGTLHAGDGTPAVVGDLLLVGGKIQAIGTVATVPDNTEIIDVAGKHVYPGLIATNTSLGIQEVEAVRATIDHQEAGEVNPNMRTLIAYNTDSRVTPTVRSNGVLIAQVVPEGGLYAGTSSVVQLDAWTWEQAAYAADDALHLYWPSMTLSNSRFAPPMEEQKKRLRENLDNIAKAFSESRAYAQAKQAGTLTQIDQRWEAMLPVLRKERPVWIHAQSERQLRAAIAFKVEQDIEVVLVGGADAWLMVDQLKRYNIPVVLEPTQSLPRLEDDDIDQPYKTARILHEAGVLVALSGTGFWRQRNLPFLAGTAATGGVSPEVALAMITSHAARILRIDGRTGTLAVGKDANVIVSQGDLLDMRTSLVTWACIQGRVLDLGNHHEDMYKKFKLRYGMP
jgi:imidazolonepropionase-like amidohydrolase